VTDGEMPVYHPVYSGSQQDLLIPYSCPVCTKCWLHIRGTLKGKCAFGGPYPGYADADPADPAPPLSTCRHEVA
jgi:hypothetical protein